jgi:arsenical pump membrane protein
MGDVLRDQVPAVLVVVATLAAVLLRPRGLDEAWAAGAGALAMLLVTPLGLDALPAVARETADVLLFLLGMMVLTALVEQAGVFALLAEGCARLARGSGPALFVVVFLLGAVITALLSLDVTVIMLTPIVYLVAVRRRLDPLPFLFACTFVANTASLPLPISNLTNLLVYADLDPGFAPFARVMFWPNLAALVANIAVFFVLFRTRIPRRFAIVSSDPLPPIDRWFLTAAGVLVATLAGLIALGLASRPLAPAALAGAVALALAGAALGRAPLRATPRFVAWPVFGFVAGMFLVVRGVEVALLDGLALPIPHDPVGAMVTGAITAALGSNLVNNVPMTLLMISLFPRVDGAAREALAWGTLLGANIGPVLTTYGSLATMLWLTLVRKRGVSVTTRAYLRVSLITMPVVLAAAMLALWLQLR